MFKRFLEEVALAHPDWRQMRFIAGPRQSGKTTLAKAKLTKEQTQDLYFNWDERMVRQRYADNPGFLAEEISPRFKKKPLWLCHDEIHKLPNWKNILKGQFDALEVRTRFIVTGSARLDFFRRSGDSLAGRYFLYHSFPLSLGEVSEQKLTSYAPELEATTWMEKRIQSSKKKTAALENLLKYSGFPEPFKRADTTFLGPWHNDYVDRLVREDARDLTKIGALENIATLLRFLPKRVGSPLSVNALREDLEVAHATVKNYLRALELLYVTFTLTPYTKKINRSIKKECKSYLFDWSQIDDPGHRFENYLAVELKHLTSLWTDGGLGNYSLHFVRNKDGRESDFLICKDQKPWLLCEAKLQDQPIERHHLLHTEQLGNIPLVQICANTGILRIEDYRNVRISADRLLG